MGERVELVETPDFDKLNPRGDHSLTGGPVHGLVESSTITERRRYRPAMAFLYILECGDGTYYVGSTRNLDHRMEQHHSGHGGQYTAKRLPVKLVFFQEFDRVDEAWRREKQVQGWGRAKRRALIEGRLGDLPALSASGRAD
jgi:putative endonuclease